MAKFAVGNGACPPLSPIQTGWRCRRGLLAHQPFRDSWLFKAHAKGVQIYPCDPATHKFGKAHPDAVLVTKEWDIIHHTSGPKWTAADGSWVTGTVLKSVAAPSENAIPWLLLQTTSGGPNGVLSKVTYIQRVYTEHGTAPAHGCDADEAGREKPVFYEAEYYFYVPKS